MLVRVVPVKSNGRAKYVELSVECLRTRVRFPPPPPWHPKKPSNGRFFFVRTNRRRSAQWPFRAGLPCKTGQRGMVTEGYRPAIFLPRPPLPMQQRSAEVSLTLPAPAYSAISVTFKMSLYHAFQMANFGALDHGPLVGVTSCRAGQGDATGAQLPHRSRFSNPSPRNHMHLTRRISTTLTFLWLVGCSQERPVPTLPVPASPAAAVSRYHNVRFDFRVVVPQAQFSPQGESDNGDGQLFSSADGKAEVRAYGGWLMEPDIKCSAASVFASKSPTISYQRNIGATSIVSGTIQDNIFYTKVIRAKDRCLTLILTYPVSERHTYDALVGPLANSFQG